MSFEALKEKGERGRRWTNLLRQRSELLCVDPGPDALHIVPVPHLHVGESMSKK